MQHSSAHGIPWFLLQNQGDNWLRALHHREDPQCRMTEAEVMTATVLAALFFGFNLDQTPEMLEDSRTASDFDQPVCESVSKLVDLILR